MRLTNLPRAGAWTFVSLLGISGLLATYPGGAVELVRDLRDYLANAERVKEGDLVKKDIFARFALQHDREELKQQLRGQLARGEVSLGEAARWYQQSLATEPHLLELFRRGTPGNTDEERAAANLIREVLAFQPISEENRLALLEQFESRYGTTYPFELPHLSAGLPNDGEVVSRP